MQKVATVVSFGMEMKRDLDRDKAPSQPQGGISSSSFGKRKDEQQPTALLPALTFKVLSRDFCCILGGKKKPKPKTKTTPVSYSHIKNKRSISVG